MKRLLFFILLPVIANAQTVTTIAGKGTSGDSGDGGLAINAEFNYPGVVRIDSAGNIYVVDISNNAIRKIDLSGIITTIVGGGTLGYSGDGGPAVSAKVNGPHDVAFDKAGNLYFPDMGNNVIRKINTSGIISTVAGTGTAGFFGDGGPATSAQLDLPYAIYIDDLGNLFVSDLSNLRVRKINASGIISTVAGNGSAGFGGDGGPATSAEFSFNAPDYISVDHAGNIYIGDPSNGRVRKVNASGTITSIAGNGSGVNSGDGGAATSAGIGGPTDAIMDAYGNLFISDGHASIRMVNTAGIITTIAGTGTKGFSGDGGLAALAEFNDPHCSYIDKNENLYIADILNNRIRKVHLNLSVSEVRQLSFGISVYPNPASSQISITANSKIETIVVTNTIGQTIFTQDNINSETLKINVADFKSGIYFIKVNGLFADKFIKN
jgi:sugar lactone lactonase YvrE